MVTTSDSESRRSALATAPRCPRRTSIRNDVSRDRVIQRPGFMSRSKRCSSSSRKRLRLARISRNVFSGKSFQAPAKLARGRRFLASRLTTWLNDSPGRFWPRKRSYASRSRATDVLSMVYSYGYHKWSTYSRAGASRLFESGWIRPRARGGPLDALVGRMHRLAKVGAGGNPRLPAPTTEGSGILPLELEVSGDPFPAGNLLRDLQFDEVDLIGLSMSSAPCDQLLSIVVDIDGQNLDFRSNRLRPERESNVLRDHRVEAGRLFCRTVGIHRGFFDQLLQLGVRSSAHPPTEGVDADGI